MFVDLYRLLCSWDLLSVWGFVVPILVAFCFVVGLFLNAGGFVDVVVILVVCLIRVFGLMVVLLFGFDGLLLCLGSVCWC